MTSMLHNIFINQSHTSFFKVSIHQKNRKVPRLLYFLLKIDHYSHIWWEWDLICFKKQNATNFWVGVGGRVMKCLCLANNHLDHGAWIHGCLVTFPDIVISGCPQVENEGKWQLAYSKLNREKLKR